MWVDDQHIGCDVGDAADHGWCLVREASTCTWCGHPGCTVPLHEKDDPAWLGHTVTVLQEVLEERLKQVERYGLNADLEDGTGPTVRWFPVALARAATASRIEEELRADYEDYERETGFPTFMHLVREEVAEAFQEDDPERLAEELVQVAALCVSWVALIRQR